MNMLAGLNVHLRLQQLRLQRLLPWRKTAAPRRPPCCATHPDVHRELPPGDDADESAAASAEDLNACRCGWFDSSHELRHGLQVSEHASSDCPDSALPLAQWLELHLHGWRGQAPAAAAM